jgi:hypothetical protein
VDPRFDRAVERVEPARERVAGRCRPGGESVTIVASTVGRGYRGDQGARTGAGEEVPTVDHWSAPDVPGDILAAAWRPGLPAPTEIHVRPELVPLLGSPRVEAPPVRVVVDEGIPAFPGYEVHRSV